MGLRDRDLGGATFRMREKMIAIGDDYWIEDDQGHRVYKVDGKAVRWRETFVVEDASGSALCNIQ
jgi:uncharacterized protein YxjI